VTQPTYYIDGLFRQANSRLARNYLGIDGGVFFRDSASIDAFGRLRVSDPTTLFSSLLNYDLDPIQWEAGSTGNGVAPAFSVNTRMAALSCSGGAGTSFMQSYAYIPIQPGNSQAVWITGVLGAPVNGVNKDVGLFDAGNGMFYRQHGLSGPSFVQRSSASGSVVDVEILQADWNLDTMDGTGPSGVTLDQTKDFILALDFQYLGMGRIRMGFDIGGTIIYAHQFVFANITTVPYMQYSALPIQALLTSASGAAASTLLFKCVSIQSGSGFQTDTARDFTTPDIAITAGNAARTHLMSIRPLTTFKSVVNHTPVTLANINLIVTGNSPVFWELCVGVAFSAGPTWVDVNSTWSSVQYGHTGTFDNLTEGFVISSGYVPATATTKNAVSQLVSIRYPCTLNRAGANRALGTYSLLVTGVVGASATRASIDFAEIR
jgi:hypothetical protein